MKKIITLSIMALVLFACKKESDSKEQVCVEGIVLWGGEPAADGVGWYIRKASETDSINTTNYYVKDLPASYRIAGKKVKACLEETDEPIQCNCVGNRPTFHKLLSISER